MNANLAPGEPRAGEHRRHLEEFIAKVPDATNLEAHAALGLIEAVGDLTAEVAAVRAQLRDLTAATLG